jgi:hypothetical protein
VAVAGVPILTSRSTGRRPSIATITLLVGIVSYVAVILLAGCAPDRLQLPGQPEPSAEFTVVNPPTPTSHPVVCNGAAGEALLRGLFADVSEGREPSVAKYFTESGDFGGWRDPSVSYAIGLDVQLGNHVTLQAHLDDLVAQHAELVLTRFSVQAYSRPGTAAAGGSFTFGLQARPDAATALAVGDGEGTVDCYTGKIKSLVIGRW